MDDIATVKVFCRLKQLVHDVSFVNILQYIPSFDDIVKIRFFEKIKKHINTRSLTGFRSMKKIHCCGKDLLSTS